MILRAVRIDAMPGSKLTGKIKVLTIRRETNKSASRFQDTWRLSILVSKQQQVRRLKRTFYQSLVFNFSPRVEWKRHVLCVVCMSFPMLIILYYIIFKTMHYVVFIIILPLIVYKILLLAYKLCIIINEWIMHISMILNISNFHELNNELDLSYVINFSWTNL